MYYLILSIRILTEAFFAYFFSLKDITVIQYYSNAAFTLTCKFILVGLIEI